MFYKRKNYRMTTLYDINNFVRSSLIDDRGYAYNAHGIACSDIGRCMLS